MTLPSMRHMLDYVPPPSPAKSDSDDSSGSDSDSESDAYMQPAASVSAAATVPPPPLSTLPALQQQRHVHHGPHGNMPPDEATRELVLAQPAFREFFPRNGDDGAFAFLSIWRQDLRPKTGGHYTICHQIVSRPARGTTGFPTTEWTRASASQLISTEHRKPDWSQCDTEAHMITTFEVKEFWRLGQSSAPAEHVGDHTRETWVAVRARPPSQRFCAEPGSSQTWRPCLMRITPNGANQMRKARLGEDTRAKSAETALAKKSNNCYDLRESHGGAYACILPMASFRALQSTTTTKPFAGAAAGDDADAPPSSKAPKKAPTRKRKQSESAAAAAAAAAADDPPGPMATFLEGTLDASIRQLDALCHEKADVLPSTFLSAWLLAQQKPFSGDTAAVSEHFVNDVREQCKVKKTPASEYVLRQLQLVYLICSAAGQQRLAQLRDVYRTEEAQKEKERAEAIATEMQS